MSTGEKYVLDDLARSMADRSVSRRQALKLVAAGAAAALLSLVGAREAGAQPPCRQLGQVCGGAAQCCQPGSGVAICQRPPSQGGRGPRRCMLQGGIS